MGKIIWPCLVISIYLRNMQKCSHNHSQRLSCRNENLNNGSEAYHIASGYLTRNISVKKINGVILFISKCRNQKYIMLTKWHHHLQTNCGIGPRARQKIEETARGQRTLPHRENIISGSICHRMKRSVQSALMRYEV